MDLAEFSFGKDGTPRFHSERMVEVAVSKSDVDTERPSNLQMVSPEEMVHACFAGCAKAIQILGHCIYVAFFLFHHNNLNVSIPLRKNYHNKCLIRHS